MKTAASPTQVDFARLAAEAGRPGQPPAPVHGTEAMRPAPMPANAASGAAAVPDPANAASATVPAAAPGDSSAAGGPSRAASASPSPAAANGQAEKTGAAAAQATAAPKTLAQVAPPAPFPAARAEAGSVGGTVLALLLVVGLILGLGWLARRMPGFGRAANPALRVVGSLALGPRDRLVVVAVGDAQLLVGVGPAGMRTLHTLDTPLPETAAAAPSPFAQLLAQHFGRKA